MLYAVLIALPTDLLSFVVAFSRSYDFVLLLSLTNFMTIPHVRGACRLVLSWLPSAIFLFVSAET